MSEDRMRKDVRVFRSFAEAGQADREYYASLTPDERVALQQEMINREYGEAAKVFHRVCRVVKRGAVSDSDASSSFH